MFGGFAVAKWNAIIDREPLSKAALLRCLPPTSRAELIEIVDQTTPEDRLFLHACIEHLARAADAGNGHELDRRLDAMRADHEVSLDDARKLHEELAARGL